MNLETLPKAIKEDIEDQSLALLEHIAQEVIVIGGWGVRAHLGEGHKRYTLDIDGVTDETTMDVISTKLGNMGLEKTTSEWGILFHMPYNPEVEVPGRVQDFIKAVQLRIEISLPLIRELDTHHYFEFNLNEYEVKELSFHTKDRSVKIKVPPLEDMTAVKLGLPVDYKNNIDAAMLLQQSDLDRVIKAIRSNDDWTQMVLRRMNKLKGRIHQKDSLEHMLAISAGLDLKAHLEKLNHIEEQLKLI